MDKENIKPCPCGKIPERLYIQLIAPVGTKGCALAECEHCRYWGVEFSFSYNEIDSDASMSHAIEAWNKAPRKIDLN
jgi:hypothetical protein